MWKQTFKVFGNENYNILTALSYDIIVPLESETGCPWQPDLKPMIDLG